ncbi:MAG: class III extradiol dioxygenase subunit B-like domain-containing protein [Patescibacteria group bacterium]|jgi:aromatic ring-opening dioxygenase LigB subunit
MLNFAAITPHSPLLIPAIGKENAKKLEKTNNALRKLEENFYSAMIDDAVIITPDNPPAEEYFTINFSPNYRGGFHEFGDFSIKPNYHGDDYLIAEVKDNLRDRNSLKLVTAEELGYRCLVPLNFLCAHKKNAGVVPLNPSGLSFGEHFKFGQELAEIIINSKKRIALVASIETSNKLSKNSPDGYSPKAKKFDQKIIDFIKEKKYRETSETNPEQAAGAGFNEMSALLIFLGVLEKINHQADILSYESPFGVGNLTAEFKL